MTRVAETAALGGAAALARPVRARHGATPQEGYGFALALLAPSSALIGALLLVPLVLLLIISFKSVKLGNIALILKADFTWGNYFRVLSDPATWHSLSISGTYIAGSSIIAFGLGLATALILNEKFPAQRLFRTLILLPWAVPGITATIAFLWILQPSFGVLNFLLRTLGLATQDINWFGDSRLALAAVIFPTVWKTYPFFTIMLLAALQTIPRELYEAASIDGANRRRQFQWITWPSIRRYAIVALVFNAMYVFREFDFIYASTKGGPQGATDTIAIRIYNLAFEAFDMAAASALGVLTFVIVAISVLGFVRWQMKVEQR
ncbi:MULTISPECIES: sugar ABC transporter permease [unclassified Chelatococcus]|uniref:carbohydrate ABC transporter permease n=1 Tax=unclassified Chelatococcus TaxID=2638111 RepID=UPI001BCD58F4|nr:MULTISPECIES: sugar ABC transporter permease [unclassified Chelatococcus]CAH1655922.1 Multiple sugar transport system permease protein [Hyphomicrobiales bacterium]MBS7742534.1 sugar ABC transporter permease [Chelatococcus sp. HY11]MBX3542348.1 sugar ABC transporter permease [Chelatococcus sp.]MCO5075434.1 sugar ABC transporter permease [Chelatococcus sp.]CAH1695681.1 Multiple sugar transport system permease protein [Hyphomicrobiales bacterium]